MGECGPPSQHPSHPSHPSLQAGSWCSGRLHAAGGAHSVDLALSATSALRIGNDTVATPRTIQLPLPSARYADSGWSDETRATPEQRTASGSTLHFCRQMSEGQWCMACWCGVAMQFLILQETVPTAALSRGQTAAHRLPPWLLTWTRTQYVTLRLRPAGATSSMPSGCHVQHCHWCPAALVHRCWHPKHAGCTFTGCYRGHVKLAPPVRLEDGQQGSPGVPVPGTGCFPCGPQAPFQPILPWVATAPCHRQQMSSLQNCPKAPPVRQPARAPPDLPEPGGGRSSPPVPLTSPVRGSMGTPAPLLLAPFWGAGATVPSALTSTPCPGRTVLAAASFPAVGLPMRRLKRAWHCSRLRRLHPGRDAAQLTPASTHTGAQDRGSSGGGCRCSRAWHCRCLCRLQSGTDCAGRHQGHAACLRCLQPSGALCLTCTC